jgi:branched-chain amino acid transport system ATP-binding protein
LTVTENLETGRQAPRQWADGSAALNWTPDALYELFPNLGRMQDRRGGQMSGGEQQMLTVARTLMGNPLLVLLDEPSEGVAPVIVEQMAHMILALKARGASICCLSRIFILRYEGAWYRIVPTYLRRGSGQG